MARKLRDDILQIWAQADNDLDRFLGNCQKLIAIFDQANKDYEGRYNLFFLAIRNYAVMVVKIQKSWRKLKDEKL